MADEKQTCMSDYRLAANPIKTGYIWHVNNCTGRKDAVAKQKLEENIYISLLYLELHIASQRETAIIKLGSDTRLYMQTVRSLIE